MAIRCKTIIVTNVETEQEQLIKTNDDLMSFLEADEDFTFKIVERKKRS